MLKREQISKLKIDEINQYITAYERMVQFYNDYINREGPYEYIDERIHYIYNELSEYLIARELHIKNSF